MPKAFTPNKNIVRKSKTELVVNLDPGPFAGFETEIAKYLEGPWTSERLRVKVKWVLRTEQPDAFVLNYLATPGANSYVSFEKRELNVAFNARTITLGHELGHVLGFPDRYYYHWRKKDCAYINQYDTGDLMSDSGSVSTARSEDFSELDRWYPYR